MAGYGIRISAFFAALFLIYGVHLPYLPLWLEWRGLSAREIGMVTSAPFFLRLLATPSLAYVADRNAAHARMILRLSWLALASALLLSQMSGFWPILVAALILAISVYTIMPLTETIAIGGVRLGLDYGRMRLWGSLTFIAASFAGGAAVDWAGRGVGIWLIAIGCAATVAAAYFLPSCDGEAGNGGRRGTAIAKASPLVFWIKHSIPGRRSSNVCESRTQTKRSLVLWPFILGVPNECVRTLEPPHSPPPQSSVAPRRGIDRATVIRLARHPMFITFLIAIGTVQAAHATFYTFGAIHWRSGGLSSAWIGTLWAIGVIAEVSVFAFSRRAVAWLGPVRLMLAGALAAVLRWVVMSADPSLGWLVSLQVLHGLTYGASHLGAIHFISRAVPEAAGGTAQALYATLASGVLQGAATLLSGVLYARYGSGAYLAMALLAAIGLMAGLVLARSWHGGLLWKD